MAIVHPDTLVNIWLFGCWLDEVVVIGFTSDGNCSHVSQDSGQEDFILQSERHILLKHEFHPLPKRHNYKLCVQSRSREMSDGVVKVMPFLLMEDRRTAVSTDVPPRK